LRKLPRSGSRFEHWLLRHPCSIPTVEQLRPYRKDRCMCDGQESLEDTDSSLIPDRRVNCRMLQSGMFLDFTKGHWLRCTESLSGRRSALEMRVMTQDRRDGVELADDLPNYEVIRQVHVSLSPLGSRWSRRPENTLGKTVRKVAVTICRGPRLAPIHDACPNLAQSGCAARLDECPLLGEQRHVVKKAGTREPIAPAHSRRARRGPPPLSGARLSQSRKPV